MQASSTSDNQGRFIVFEGGDGSGKTTQANLLAKRLGATLTRHPGGTPLGAMIRSTLLDNPSGFAIAHRAEALLMAADMAQNVQQTILPALSSGVDVVCDRYIGSAIAYQGFGRQLPQTDLEAAIMFGVGGLVPDLTIYLHVDPETSAARLGRDLDRFESETTRFKNDVFAGYAHQASLNPSWMTVDASRGIDDVAANVADLVDLLAPQRT